MKILITTDLYKVTTNGVVTSVRNLMEELERKGHQIRVLTFSDNLESYQEENVYFIKSISMDFIYPNVRMPISYRNDLVRELVEWKPDVIHSQCEFFSYQFAQRISKLTGAPIVHTYHTLYEDYVTYVIPNKWVGKRMVKQMSRMRLKTAKTVIAPTSKVKDILLAYGLKNDIQIVSSGIALQQYDYRMDSKERKAKRYALGIPEGNKVMLNLGRLGTEKNLEELMEFFAEAVKWHMCEATREANSEEAQALGLTFLVVGDGPAKQGLEALAKELGVEEHVIFTGMVPPNLVREYYQLGDLFVSASTSETQGLTYVEAAANGLPLLCRKDDCLNDVLEEGVNGYQYTTKEEFLSRMQEIMQDDAWREAAGLRGREIAKGFDKSHFGDKVENIYEEACESVAK